MRSSARWLLAALLIAMGCAPPDWENDAHRGIQAARAGQLQQAELLIASALEEGASAGMPESQQGELLFWLGWVQSQADDPTESVPTLERAIVTLRESVGGRNVVVQRAVRRLAQVYARLGNLEMAERGFRDNMEITALTAPANSPERSGAINDLAFILVQRGKLEDARELVEAELARVRRYRADDRESLGSLTLLAAEIERRESNHEAAEARYREAIEIHEGDDDLRARLAEAHAGLGESLVQQGRDGEAEQHFAAARDLLRGTSLQDVANRSRIESAYPEFARYP